MAIRREFRLQARDFHSNARNSHAAFTLIELLVVIFVVVILLGMILPRASGVSQDKARRIKCGNNLKNIGLGLRIFADDNGDLFPWQSTNALGEIKVDYSKDPLHHFRAITDELSTPIILHCPADRRTRAETWSELTLENISYFISQSSAETLPQSFLAGDRNLTTNGVRLKTGTYKLDQNVEVGWDKSQHKNQGNVCMGDGSVQQLSGFRLREQFKNSGLSNIVISMP